MSVQCIASPLEPSKEHTVPQLHVNALIILVAPFFADTTVTFECILRGAHPPGEWGEFGPHDGNSLEFGQLLPPFRAEVVSSQVDWFQNPKFLREFLSFLFEQPAELYILTRAAAASPRERRCAVDSPGSVRSTRIFN